MSENYQTSVSSSGSQRSAEKVRRLTPDQLGLSLPDGSESESADVSWEEIQEEAVSAIEQAEAKGVNGCAVLTSERVIQTGTTIETPSETIHAVRVAALSAVAEGQTSIEKVALHMNRESGFCGSCRQLLYDLSDGNAEVRLIDTVGQISQYSINELLPKEK